ncbi:dihydrolipoyllysine-residue acetyltransferase domain protein, partial [Vibrio cholerae HC-52A1]
MSTHGFLGIRHLLLVLPQVLQLEQALPQILLL